MAVDPLGDVTPRVTGSTHPHILDSKLSNMPLSLSIGGKLPILSSLVHPGFFREVEDPSTEITRVNSPT